MPRLPTGLPGSTPCQRSRHAPRRSLLTSAVHSQPLMPVAPQLSGLQHRPQPTSQRRVATSPLGMLPSPRAQRPRKLKPNPATASAAGNGTPPVPATSARSRCISPPCPPHLGRCCCPKLGRTQSAASRSAPRMKQSPSRPQSSECCCCAACAYRSHSLLESVHAVDCLTRWVTIEQPVPLASRALPLERAVARVCQEAGARVARNMRLADMNLPLPVADARRIEIVCNGLPLWHGAQLAVDTTCVSPVTRSGEPRPGADSQPGLALQLATRRKRRETYPELSRSPRCRLVVFAVETGGRWGPEPTAFLRLLAHARAASAHAAVRSALRAAYVSRWSGVIAVAAQRALASSLLELPLEAVGAAAGEPAVHEVLQDARWLHTPAPSRLPAPT